MSVADEHDPDHNRSSRDGNPGDMSWRDALRALKPSVPPGGLKVFGISAATIVGSVVTALIAHGSIKIDSWLIFALGVLALAGVMGGLYVIRIDKILRAKGPYLILAATAKRMETSEQPITGSERDIVKAAIASSASDQSESDLQNLAVMIFAGNAAGAAPIEGRSNLLE